MAFQTTDHRSKVKFAWEHITANHKTGISMAKLNKLSIEHYGRSMFGYKNGYQLDALLNPSGYLTFWNNGKCYPFRNLNTGDYWYYTDDCRFIKKGTINDAP